MPTTTSLDLALDLLGTLPSRSRVTPIVRKAYAIALGDLDDSALRGAVERALAECRFRPTPAELRELAGCGNAEDAARALWDVVERAMRTRGRNASVDFGPEGNAAVRHINTGSGSAWESLCMTPQEVLVHRQRAFLAAVAGYLRSGTPPGRTEYLVGVEEAAEVARIGAWGGEVLRLGPVAEQPRLKIAAGGE